MDANASSSAVQPFRSETTALSRPASLEVPSLGSKDDIDAASDQATPPPTSPGAAPADEDEDDPVCRICLGGVDPDLGRLIVPCKCSGTARFVHEECLTSWRLADRKNGFYACGMCGARYKLRKTIWTRLSASRASIPLLTLLLILFCSLIAGYAAEPLMRFAERAKLDSTESWWQQWQPHIWSIHYFLGDFTSTGDALRETVSLVGFVLRSCRWSSARELKDVEITSPKLAAEGITLWTAERAKLTACGRFWGYERDDQEGPSARVVQGVMHLVEGYVLTALLLLLVGQYMIRWFILRNVIRGMSPSWGERLHFPQLERQDLMAASTLTTVMFHLRYFVKSARVADRLFSFPQLLLVTLVLGTLVWATFRFRSAARGIVKWRIAKVENVVLDMREVEGKGRKEE